MIEKLAPLKLPPGISKNGTLYDNAGRWYDGNLVRFHEGVARAIRADADCSLSAVTLGGTRIAGAFGYRGPIGIAFAAVVTNTKLYELEQSNGSANAIPTDITPVGFSADVPSFDTLGTTVLAEPGNGVIYSWTMDAGAVAVTTGCPILVKAMGVTPERFLLAMALNGELKWASQNTVATWTPASTNSAGGLTVPTKGEPLAIRKVGSQTLIWTSEDLWAASYIGAPLYYGVTPLATGVGLLSKRALAVIEGNKAIWMTDRGFKIFDGYVRDLPCPISDYIFDALRDDKIQRYTFAVLNHAWNEVWFFYPTSNNNYADRVAIYNYALDCWSIGSLERTAGVDSGIWGGLFYNGGDIFGPLMFTSSMTTAKYHEATGVMAGAYLESGPVVLDPAGSRVMRVQKLIPDNGQAVASETGTLYVGTYPKVAETSSAFTIPAAGGEIDVRASGRYARIKQNLTREDSRVGTWRLGVIPEGRR